MRTAVFNMKKPVFIFVSLLLANISLINGISLDNFHCKVATCREFYYGLKTYPRHQEYIDTCYDTVSALQNIPRRYGKCLDDSTMQINPSCIHALATTIKNCISQLNDLSENTARFYCGYTLMKHCAVNVGLERFRLNFQARSPIDD